MPVRPPTDPTASPVTFTVEPDEDGQRIDVVISAHTDLSRALSRSAVEDGRVRTDGRTVTKVAQRARPGVRVEVDLVPASPVDVVAQDIPLVVVYEDDQVIVVDKPAGMVVHPAPGHPDGTLVNALLYHCGDRLAGVGGVLRPGIVHRIDRGTSGLIVSTKTDEAHQHLQAQFAAHTIRREYRALCAQTSGPGLADEGTFETRHGRHPTDRKRFTGKQGPRHATTHYRVLERFEHGATLVACTLETGRTHQIRVHLSEAGCPILSDPLYGGKAVGNSELIGRLALHAFSLGFELPDGRTLYFEAEPPEDFAHALEQLRGGASWRK